MKKIVFISFLFIFISQTASASNTLPSNESFYRESVTTQTTINKELKQANFQQPKQTTEAKSTAKKQIKNLTNYQYDEDNYHYNKIKNYIQDNLDYSNSGRLKY